MGGQTARMLQFLIENSFYQDKNNKVLEESPLLGVKESGLIKSITSISTPHNGTTLTGIVTKIMPFIQYFIGIAGLIDGNGFYDFDLQQWGFYRYENERWPTYLNRLRKHKSFKTKNISSWDLSLQGAKKLNDFLIASPDIYYFSLVTSITKLKNNSNYHKII